MAKVDSDLVNSGKAKFDKRPNAGHSFKGIDFVEPI